MLNSMYLDVFVRGLDAVSFLLDFNLPVGYYYYFHISMNWFPTNLKLESMNSDYILSPSDVSRFYKSMNWFPTILKDILKRCRPFLIE